MVIAEPMVLLSLAVGFWVVISQQQEISSAEEEEKKAEEPFPASEIREMCKMWETLQTFMEKHRPKPGVVVHASNLSTWEAETGGTAQVQGQPGLHREALSQEIT